MCQTALQEALREGMQEEMRKKNVFSNTSIDFTTTKYFETKPWGYLVAEKKWLGKGAAIF